MSLQKNKAHQQDVLGKIMFRFIPYWPLFILLLLLSLTGAILYLRYATPLYEASATLLLKDEKKGADDSHLLDQLNVYHTKKIVENEVEVLQSRSLMQRVVKTLGLYTSVYEQGKVKAVSAYASSPIVVDVKNPDSVIEAKVAFRFGSGKVAIDNVLYPLNAWVTTPYGIFLFKVNPRIVRPAKNSLFFTVTDYKSVANNFSGKLSVAASSKLSSIVGLTFKDEDPKRATDILNELLRTYNQEAIDDKNALASNTLSFVDDRLNAVSKDLEEIEKRIQAFRSREGAIDLSEQGKLFLKNVSDNDMKVADINMQLAVIDQVEKYVLSKDSKGGIVPSTLGIDDVVLTTLLQQLNDVELQYEKLKRTTAENNPALVALANQMEKIRPNILDNIRAHKASLQAGQRDLMYSTNTFSGMLQQLPEKERELLEISRQQTIKSNVYSFLLQKREETALSYAATIADSRVVDPADAIAKPVSPKRLVVFPIAIVAAIILCYLFVVFKEMMSNKVLFRSEIERLTSVPILAELSKTKTKEPFVTNNAKEPFIAEQFRQLRTALGIYGSNAMRRKLLITSSIPGEGKSYVASNLALSLALDGKKVVLIDMDLRNPKISGLFGLTEEIGVSDYLTQSREEYEIIRSTAYDNLFVIGAGSEVVNPTGLFMNGRLARLFKMVDETFDFVIVDSSPVDAATDSYIFSELCDATLFVVRHGKTPKAMVELLDESNKIKVLKNIAIAFNGVKPRGFVKGVYGHGFGYGHAYVYKNKIVKTKRPQKV